MMVGQCLGEKEAAMGMDRSPEWRRSLAGARARFLFYFFLTHVLYVGCASFGHIWALDPSYTIQITDPGEANYFLWLATTSS
jgi:hypothetical protein